MAMDGDLELPVHSDGPEEEVEFDLTDEELGGEDAGAGAAPAPDEAEGEDEAEAEEAQAEEGEEDAAARPKRKRSPDKRISELSRRAQEAEHRAQQYEAQMRQEAALRAQSDSAMMTHYENSLKMKAADARRRLLEAKSLGDSESEVDAQTELMQAQNDLSGIQSWKANAPAPHADGGEVAPSPQPQRQGQPQLEAKTAEWIQGNEWFQPQSENFDSEMHEEATLYARRIERRYRAEGRAEEIGSGPYFKEIDRHMLEEFPDAFEGRATPKRSTPPMSRDSRVAPVSRSGTPPSAGRAGNKVRLSADQRKFAHQMAASGAYTRPTGGRMTNEEAERHYAVYLIKQSRS